MRDLLARPDGWDSWSDEAKAAYNAALRAELARLRGRAWEKLARPKQLAPDHPRHSAADENGFRCGCAAGDPEWRTFLLLAGRGVGKTWVGSNWILSQAIAQPGTFWGVAAPTIGDVERTCFLGEALALDTYVPTSSGHTTMGELKPGDIVIGGDGSPCRVTAAYAPLVNRDCYRVTFKGGAQVIADADHKWLVQTYLNRSYERRGRIHEPLVMTTAEMVPSLRYEKMRGNSFNYGISVAKASYSDKAIQLPIDPYVLGYWLGDGTAKSAEITTMDPEVLVSVMQAGYDIVQRAEKRDHGRARTYGIYDLWRQLRLGGLLRNKHVPDAYLRASAADRLALVQGLMDSDGYVSARDGVCEFCNKNKGLADALVDLLGGLGIKASAPRAKTSRVGTTHWLVWFKTTVPVFRIGRKAARLSSSYRDADYLMISSIEPVQSVPVRCISVDSPGRTYLVTRHHIATHNSGILSVAEEGDIPPNGYNINKNRITLSNGSVIQGFSADSAERARGANLWGLWADELALFKYESFYHEVLQPALRRGDARMLITTTPKRMRLLRQILRKAEDPGNHIHITRASSDENPHFSKMRLDEIKSNYAGTRLYKQEIEGIFNDDVAGALFSLDMISEARIDRAGVPDLARVVVAVDPAQTSSEGADESGIVVAGDDGCGHAYVLADYSLRGSPEQVMRRAVDAYRTHAADCIVFEDQSGGDWLVTALRHVDPNVPYKKVHAMRGKYLRAQPVGMLMEQKRIHHAGTAEEFERLEDQLCAITEDSDRSKAHDDRADAYVYAIAELRGLSGGSWLGAYSMIKCEDCRKVYRDTELKCPKCGLEREVFDPPDHKKGPGAQFRDGEGEAGWREVYAPAPEAAIDRQCRLLQQVISGQPGQMAGAGQSWAQIWKRARYR